MVGYGNSAVIALFTYLMQITWTTNVQSMGPGKKELQSWLKTAWFFSWIKKNNQLKVGWYEFKIRTFYKCNADSFFGLRYPLYCWGGATLIKIQHYFWLSSYVGGTNQRFMAKQHFLYYTVHHKWPMQFMIPPFVTHTSHLVRIVPFQNRKYPLK